MTRPRAARAGALLALMMVALGFGAATAGRVSAGSRAEATPDVVDVPLRIEGAVDGFADLVLATLNDPRSWSGAGFRFRLDPSSQYRVVLAEPAAVDRLCAPLVTHGDLSCQNGNVVALNAERWREGVSEWDRPLSEYRQYMINHEVGHLIGQRHPQPRCPDKGTPAAVMEQQTKGLEGCTGNAWPLAWEVERAAGRPVVMAPAPDWNPRPVPVNLGGTATTAASTIPATSPTTGPVDGPTSTVAPVAAPPATASPPTTLEGSVAATGATTLAPSTSVELASASGAVRTERAGGAGDWIAILAVVGGVIVVGFGLVAMRRRARD